MLLQRERTGMAHRAGPERVSRWELAQRFAAAAGVSIDHLAPGECHDDRRPRDVSMISDLSCRRNLDDALAES